MAIESKRTSFGATDKGEVWVIAKDVNDLASTNADQAAAGSIDTNPEYSVREGGRTVLTTDSKSEAEGFAKTLVKHGGIVAIGVDERPVSAVGKVTPREHRIATHELRVQEEPDKLLGDETERIEGTDVTDDAEAMRTPATARRGK